MFLKSAIAILLYGCISSTTSIDTSGCGTTKACVFSSDGCSPTNANCLIFTFAWNASESIFNMELSGGTGNGNQYVAVAFSPDGSMQNSDLYFCTGNSFQSGSIQGRYLTPTTDSALPSAITNPLFGTNSGVAECSFTRTASVTKSINGVDTIFDLATANFYILQAVGNYATDTGIQQHAADGRFSTGPYNFINGEIITATTQPSTTTTGGNSPSVPGCGTSKGCFQNPVSCSPGAAGCMFASWSYDSDENAFTFEIVGGAGSQYAAIAFGNVASMVDADLYFCTASGLGSGAIQAEESRPSIDAVLPTELTNITNSVNEGAVNCTFRRPAGLSKTVSNGLNVDFNLQQNNYFLLYAVGSFSAGLIQYHGSNGRTASPSAINFTQLGSSGGGGGSSGNTIDLIKAHACLMLVAWMTFASIGVIIARHFKPLWHDSSCIGEKVWFQMHRTLMVLVLLCTITGFVLVFVANEGEYSSNAGAHPVIGIIVTCLVVINPVMALFRPHPGTPKRKIFNWAHWFVGLWARTLGIVAIFLGVDLTILDLPEWDTWVLVGFVAFNLVTEVVLELLSARYGHIAGFDVFTKITGLASRWVPFGTNSSVYLLAVLLEAMQLTKHRDAEERNSPTYFIYKKESTDEIIGMGDEQPKPPPPPEGAYLKYGILIVYSVCNIAFLLTFLVTIIRHDN